MKNKINNAGKVKKISIDLDFDIFNELKSKAKLEDRSISFVIRNLIINFLTKKKVK